MTIFFEFINKNLINFNQSKLYNVIRTPLFVQMITGLGQFHHKKIQILQTFLGLVIHFKFLNHAIQISLLILRWAVMKSQIRAGVKCKFAGLSFMVNGTQMVFLKPFSNAPSVGADQKERPIWILFTLLSKMVQERFRMSQTQCLMSHFNNTLLEFVLLQEIRMRQDGPCFYILMIFYFC